MPLLFSLGQHAALEAVKARMVDGEVLLAFLNDVYVITTPERVGDVYVALQEELHQHARIRIHVGKTQVWNAVGERPDACEVLERIAQAENPSARVWKGSDIPTVEQGVTVLGTPLGDVDFVEAQLTKKLAEHTVFLERIPLLADVQSAWSLLLHCAGGRANYLLRVVRPELVETFAAGHNAGLWECFKRILKLDFDVDSTVKYISSLQLAMGGLGLRSASRTSESAYWASWADSLPMISERHPTVAGSFARRLERGEDLTPTMASAVLARHHLSGVEGFEPPSWEALVQGARPPEREPEDFEPGGTRYGWQHEASSRTELQFKGRIMSTLAEHEQALLRSQSGPLAGTSFSAAPSNWSPELSRISSGCSS